MSMASPAFFGLGRTEVFRKEHFGETVTRLGFRATHGEPNLVYCRSLLGLAVLMALAIKAMPEIAVGQTPYDLPQGGSLRMDQSSIFGGTPDVLAGSGSFRPGVSLQNNGLEQGYNSGGSPLMADVKNGIDFHFANFRVPANSGGTINGVAYYSFALDVDKGSGGDTPNSLTDRSGTASTVYDLDASGGKSLFFDGALVGRESSSTDVEIRMPQSVFAPNAGSANNVFLSFQLASIGTPGRRRWNTESGSEDWNPVSRLTVTIAQPVPEPGTVGAAAAVIAVSGWSWYSRKRNCNRKLGNATRTSSPAESESSVPASETEIKPAQA